MGEVVEFNNYVAPTPRFSIDAEMSENGSWTVSVTDFYDKRMEIHEVYREIADALIPIAGGMVHSAEELEPTKRGCIVANISIYNNGNIEFRSNPLDTEERKAWLISALNKVKRQVKGGGKKGNGLDK